MLALHIIASESCWPNLLTRATGSDETLAIPGRPASFGAFGPEAHFPYRPKCSVRGVRVRGGERIDRDAPLAHPASTVYAENGGDVPELLGVRDAVEPGDDAAARLERDHAEEPSPACDEHAGFAVNGEGRERDTVVAHEPQQLCHHPVAADQGLERGSEEAGAVGPSHHVGVEHLH